MIIDYSKGRKGAKKYLTWNCVTFAFHAYIRAIQAIPLLARAFSLCYVMQSAERWSLEKQAEMEKDARCKLWPGGCGLMGKCFLLQVRRTLFSWLSRHVDSPRWLSARSYECNRSAGIAFKPLRRDLYVVSNYVYTSVAHALQFGKKSERYVEKARFFSEINTKLRESAENRRQENCKIVSSVDLKNEANTLVIFLFQKNLGNM